jgi:hypothetical protein
MSQKNQGATPFVLVALLLFALPLLFTLRKFVELFTERNHQLLALYQLIPYFARFTR